MAKRGPPAALPPYQAWPTADHAAWEAAIAEGDILDGRGPAAHWSPATRRTNIQHYSRWLGYLAHIGRLVGSIRPEGRVTEELVRGYLDCLRSEVAPRTVVSSLVGLKVVMKAMAPQMDWQWLADVCNALNWTSEPQKDKRSHMRPTADIYAAAIRELVRLLNTPLRRRIERVAYRDTLMLAMIAARPVRLKNVSSMRIGRHLVLEGSTWLLVFPGAEVKNRRLLEYAVPRSLVPYLETYLDRVRPTFLKRGPSDALWPTFEGDPLDDHSIYYRFMIVTKRLLGVEINPHLLRDCAATSLSTVSPGVARSAATLLGHRNFATTERYYIRANQLEAGRNVNALLASIKSTLK